MGNKSHLLDYVGAISSFRFGCRIRLANARGLLKGNVVILKLFTALRLTGFVSWEYIFRQVLINLSGLNYINTGALDSLSNKCF